MKLKHEKLKKQKLVLKAQAKPSVQALIAELIQFVNYVDEYLKLLPDHKHIGLIDVTVLKNKCKAIQDLVNKT